MPSSSRSNLRKRLKDVDEIVFAHLIITGGQRGRPPLGRGAALTRAGIVLLTSIMEAFVEDIFEESAKLLLHGRTSRQTKELFEATSKRLNVADYYKTNLLFFNLGIPWTLEQVRWQKFSNKSFRKTLNKLVDYRNKIAHGSQPPVRIASLRKWRGFVLKYSEKLEEILSTVIEEKTGTPPPW